MVRIIIKGGGTHNRHSIVEVWKNTEDEVLKAAIAKYGKNQWARISSLLVRKTPKQCKARWYEWLDPSIKKTEWSKTEDEKLLHLAKLMPTQWRTIAPIVGRTATQCLERYQKLLDEAEAKENEELGLIGVSDAGPSAEDVRRLRPGEIDPDPETKPARPDPIDMDEDEKEMLSEARARLANTQGKKAKRKARERQLEEARRLAMLQKKRELKAAGIIGSMRTKSKKKGMDYNADIPFEKKPAAGFYDTSDEQARITAAPVGQSLRRLENKRKPEEEEAERKKRQRKNEKEGDPNHQTKFVAARDAQIQKLKEAESIGRRRKLVLPGAQVGESELEEIVKIGRAGQSARELLGEGNEATDRLLGDYEGLDKAKMARTPRTAPQHDTIMAEARNLRNMTVAQTPLLGDENTPLHDIPGGGTGFEGATPRHQVAFTPNPLATPYRNGRDVSATPRTEIAGATPLRTPLRDSLSINPDGRSFTDEISRSKSSLRASLASLPKPENNFELVVPEDDEADNQETLASVEEDASERDARLKRQIELQELQALGRRSEVVKQGLPRLVEPDIEQLMSEFLKISDEDPSVDTARKLVDRELAELVQHDAIAHPLPGTLHTGASTSNYVLPDDDLMDKARALVKEELAKSLGFPDANAEQVSEGLSAIAQSEGINDSLLWSTLKDNLVYDSSQKRWVEPDILPLEDRLAGYSSLLQGDRDRMTKEANKSAKLEKKLGVQLGGYQARQKVLTKRIIDAFEFQYKQQLDIASFDQLHIQESAVGPRRVQSLKDEVETLERRENLLQERYRELTSEQQEINGRITRMEEDLMASVEGLNDAALADAAESN